MDGRRIACDRCGAEVGAEERHAEIEYIYGDGGGNMTLCRDCFKLVMDTVHGQEAKRQGDAEPPTMDERRAVARRMRGYDCPVLPSHQTTREAVDAAVGCMGLEEGEKMCTVRQFLDRLADLIEPGEPKVKCVAEVKIEGDKLDEAVHRAMAEYAGVDREALLALADEMDDACPESASVAIGYIDDYARRIREALGVVG